MVITYDRQFDQHRLNKDSMHLLQVGGRNTGSQRNSPWLKGVAHKSNYQLSTPHLDHVQSFKSKIKLKGTAIVRTRWDPKKFQVVSTKEVIFIRPEMSSHISNELFQQKRFTGSLNQSLAARHGNWKPNWNSESSSMLCLFKWYCHHVFCEFVSRSFPNTSDEQGVVDTIVTSDSRTKRKASLTQQTSQNMRTQKHAKTAGTTRTFRENQFETIRIVAVGMHQVCTWRH